MAKIKVESSVALYPMPVLIVGTHVEGKPNFMTVGWATRMNPKPPILGIAVVKTHQTAQGIIENEAFSINIPNAELLKEADCCGIFSGREMDKAAFFDVFYGSELQAAPMIAQCPICHACKLVDTIELDPVHFFLGEIVETYTEKKYLTFGKPDLTKTNPFVLTLPDGNYRSVGDVIGKAWEIGAKHKP
ncbi:MAG: flavin reductase family protein [Candidatus Coatesbacteria bacterium]|nr:flavin reductase family protein [Candidatus Coatesbacteria bacterium]